MLEPPPEPAMRPLIHAINKGPLSDGLMLLPHQMNTLRARAILLTIGLQESRLADRDQLERNGRNTVLGPALGLWQFELGGVRGVLRHRATKPYMDQLCEHYGLHPAASVVWRALKTNDTLAAAVARLNLWWSPWALPGLEDVDGAWEYYLNCWRPGAVKRDPEGLRAKWGRNHAAVLEYLRDIP